MGSIIPPFDRRGNWSSERWSDVPKVPEAGNSRARILILQLPSLLRVQAWFFQWPCSLPVSWLSTLPLPHSALSPVGLPASLLPGQPDLLLPLPGPFSHQISARAASLSPPGLNQTSMKASWLHELKVALRYPLTHTQSSATPYSPP
jgi:hypothetical protein